MEHPHDISRWLSSSVIYFPCLYRFGPFTHGYETCGSFHLLNSKHDQIYAPVVLEGISDGQGDHVWPSWLSGLQSFPENLQTEPEHSSSQDWRILVPQSADMIICGFQYPQGIWE